MAGWNPTQKPYSAVDYNVLEELSDTQKLIRIDFEKLSLLSRQP
jgi:hypothetical protein